MKELKCNAWDEQCDALCITTNGFTKANGSAVMGRGIALQAKQKICGIDKVLGKILKEYGNHVHYLTTWINLTCTVCTQTVDILSFPTKHVWWENSNIELIKQSTLELVNLADQKAYDRVLLPRPGCSNGKLDWSIVKPIIELLLDDRFYIITNGT